MMIQSSLEITQTTPLISSFPPFLNSSFQQFDPQVVMLTVNTSYAHAGTGSFLYASSKISDSIVIFWNQLAGIILAKALLFKFATWPHMTSS